MYASSEYRFVDNDLLSIHTRIGAEDDETFAENKLNCLEREREIYISPVRTYGI